MRSGIVFFLLFLMAGSSMFSQTRRSYNIYLKVNDAFTEKPIGMATVTLMNEADTTKFKYTSSDSGGSATVKSVMPGKYILKIEYMGYGSIREKVSIVDRSVDMGTFKMSEQANILKEAVISAVGNPIIVKKDTIEYTASSYKISDSDMLEDLLKKLPGVEVSSDGTITANGEEVKKVMIDGKTFFLDDPQLATKNLPANIIDKIKVVEKKSDQALFTGIDDGEEETVIDLSVKPGMMNGWFGNASGGYGTDNRFQAGVMTSRFTKESQITFLGNANNTNNRGFFDFAGGMMQSMRAFRNQMSGGGGGGGFGGNGITTSGMAGVNANKELLGGKLKLQGSYMFNASRNEKLSDSYKETFMEADTLLINDDNSTSLTNTSGHMFGGEVEWNITDRTSIKFEPQINIGKGDFNESSTFLTENNFLGKKNDGESRSYGDNTSLSANGTLLIRHRFGKPGRTISLRTRYSYSDNESDAYNYSITNLYNEGTLTGSDIVDQHYVMSSTSSSINSRLSYTEPLGNDFYIEAAYSFKYNKSLSDKIANNKNSVTGEYDVLDEEYSNSYENLFINQVAELNLTQTKEKYRFVIGASLQPSFTQSLGGDTDIKRNVINYSPNGMFEYRFSESERLRIRYNGRTNQPSISQLQPVPDNSNPLMIQEGNPDLLPEFSHNLNVDYRFSNKKNFSMISAQLRTSYTMDKIINKSWYDENGVQHTRPVNEQGVYSINPSLMFNLPIKKSGFSVSSRTTANFNNSYSYIRDVKNNVKNLSFSEWLRMMFRNDYVEVSLGGMARYTRAWYSQDSQGKPAAWTNSVTASLNVSLPWDMNIKSDANYTFYLGYDEEYNEPSIVWNAELSKQLFKKKATLAFKVYDILQQAKSVYRVTDDEYIMDVSTNSLKQYFMLTFTYRFGNFGKGRGPGAGPMGPPPHH